MKTIAAVFGPLLIASAAAAQGPGGPAPSGGDPVAQLMAFDKDKDGKLTKAEITDPRLQRVFDRADADKDGTVTAKELNALAAKEQPAGGRGGPGMFGPGGPGGPGGMRGGPPRPGEVLPGFFRQNLNLSASQQKEIDDLQKDVDAKMAKILNDEQKAQLKQMQQRGPGGPGGPGGRGPGGPGGPGGPPPGEGPPPRD